MSTERDKLISFIKEFDQFFDNVDFKLYTLDELQDLRSRLESANRSRLDQQATPSAAQPEQ